MVSSKINQTHHNLTKMNKQFYAITLDEAIAQYQKKWISATALLYYYLRIRLAPGWKMTLHQREITEKLGIPKTSFYRAIEKLSADGLIEWEAPNGLVVSVPRMELSPTNGTQSHEWNSQFHEWESSPTNETSSSTNGTGSPPQAPREKAPSPSSDSYQITNKSLSNSEREENSVSQNSFPTQESETSNNLVPSSSSSNSLVEDKNLGLDQKKPQNRSLVKSLNSNISNNYSDPRPQTYSDLIGALDESAQEKFLLFAKKKAASLPKPPTLSNRWIEKNFDELYEQWRASEQRLQENLALRTASLTASDQEARREEPSEKMVSLSGDLLRKLKEEVMKNV